MEIKVIRRLGLRLDHIFQWIKSAPPYDNIWDLCCDHGRLGLHLHERHPDSQIYLVDKVASIIDKLVIDFNELNDGRLHFKTADACQLNIHAEKPTVIIIAGVGGQNIINILESILPRLSGNGKLEFILSPNGHMFELRKFLKDSGFHLIEEAFIKEKGFCHEHLWLGYKQQENGVTDDALFKPVPDIGDAIWQDMTDTKREYICKLIKHYRRMLDNHHSPFYKDALAAYQRLL